jgi:hypothetical protein
MEPSGSCTFIEKTSHKQKTGPEPCLAIVELWVATEDQRQGGGVVVMPVVRVCPVDVRCIGAGKYSAVHVASGRDSPVGVSPLQDVQLTTI